MSIITCQKCGQKMRIATPTGPARVSCPKCGQQLLIGNTRPKSPGTGSSQSPQKLSSPKQPVGATNSSADSFPARRESSASTGNAPLDPLAFDLPKTTSGQTFPAAPTAKPSGAKSQKGIDIKLLAIASGGVIAVLAIVIVAVSMMGSSGDGSMTASATSSSGQSSRVSADGQSLTPRAFFDSVAVSSSEAHASCIDDFIALSIQFGDMMQASQGKIDDSVSSKLKTFDQEYVGLYNRFLALPLMDSQAAQSLGQKLRGEPPKEAAEVRQQAEAFRQQLSTASNGIKTNFNRVAARFAATQQGFLFVAMEVKPPASFAQDFHCRMLELNRRILQSTLSSSDPSAVVGVINQQIEVLRQMRMDNHWWVRFGKPVTDKRSVFLPRLEETKAAVDQQIKSLPSLVQDAYVEFKEAVALVLQQPDRQPVARQAGPQRTQVPEAVRQMEEREEAMFRQRVSGMFANQIESLKKRFPPGQAVVIELASPLEFDVAFDLESVLDSKFRTKFGAAYADSEDRAVVVLGVDGPIESVIRELTFGTVTGSNQQERTIQFTLDPKVELEKLMQDSFSAPF